MDMSEVKTLNVFEPGSNNCIQKKLMISNPFTMNEIIAQQILIIYVVTNVESLNTY